MATTKTKSAKQIENDPTAANGVVSAVEVLTLKEAAAYLRIAESEVIRMVDQQSLPGRLIGTEWRFLKPALQDWLRTPPPRPSKEAVLARIGSWQNDPHLEQELEEIHKRRGRMSSDKRALWPG
jgi:excisionase family DNA binding protein